MLEKFCTEVICEDRKGFIPVLMRGFLTVCSWAFRLGTFCRNWAYNKGLLKCFVAPIPKVISVGNIVAGGTGKTPVTLKLAKEMVSHNAVAILTRGYKSPVEHLKNPVVLSQGKGPLYPPSYCGDEPYLLSTHIPEAQVIVGKHRVKAAMMAVRNGAEVLILDDGMQHRGLARDVEIVVVDAQSPFGLGYFLPRGRLRESPKELKRADLVVVNHAKERKDVLTIKHQLAKYTKAPVVAMRPKMSELVDQQGNRLDSLRGDRVGLFCGLANPNHFREMVQGLGATIVKEEILLDHATAEVAALIRFGDACKSLGAKYLVCTEKDQVKLHENLEISLPIVCIKIDLEIVDGEEHWQEFIKGMTECNCG